MDAKPEVTATPTPKPSKAPEKKTEKEKESENLDEEGKKILARADKMAAQYNYDKAIKYLKEQPEYENTKAFQKAVTEYENTRATCVEYPLEEVTHVFFHTLIVDTSKAFDGDSD